MKFDYDKLFKECYKGNVGDIKLIEKQLGYKIPKKEQWLWENKKSLKSILEGLESPIVATLHKDDDLDEFIKKL